MLARNGKPEAEEFGSSSMIDLHCHMLPGIDDGAGDLAVSLQMARAAVAQGIEIVACTPHILPGLYHNSGPAIRQATQRLQERFDAEGIPLRLVAGADVHMTPDFVAGLRSGHLLSIADSRYVLVEPPHHSAPPQLEGFFFNLVVAGYVPILTHPVALDGQRVIAGRPSPPGLRRAACGQRQAA
jgi:protein-tyrosine phosphatase